MDFTEECDKNPALKDFIVGAINTNSVGLENPLDQPECPKLDSDFSKMVMLNGLPICAKEKIEKLKTKFIMKKALAYKINLTEEQIEIAFEDDDDTKNTTGQAYLTLDSDEQAKITALIFNQLKLDSKHTFSACTFPDFYKIMAYGEKEEKTQKDSKEQYLELNNHMLETKKNIYAMQVSKKIVIGALHGMTKVLWNLDESEREKEPDNSFESDKKMLWSPRGTYLVLIKSDKVEFIGGSKMEPILAIAEPKVETVIFSPCEKYIVLYIPKKEKAYEVWDF